MDFCSSPPKKFGVSYVKMGTVLRENPPHILQMTADGGAGSSAFPLFLRGMKMR